jgi:crossover junction endodeoxyribonuclease RuvC
VKILGIDPSLRSTGYGLIGVAGNQMTHLAHGEIKNPATVLPSRCLVKIGDTIRDLILQHQPGIMVIEGLVYVQNTKIAFTLGEVRGIAIATAAAHGLDIFEYAPRKVKQSVTGLGGAGKQQVGHMVKALLALPATPPPDAGDALALAICHAQSCQGVQLSPAKPL